jgi:hypothetical protein
VIGDRTVDASNATRTASWPQQDLFPQLYAPQIAPRGVVNAASFQPGALAPESLFTIFASI